MLSNSLLQVDGHEHDRSFSRLVRVKLLKSQPSVHEFVFSSFCSSLLNIFFVFGYQLVIEFQSYDWEVLEHIVYVYLFCILYFALKCSLQCNEPLQSV